MQKNNIDRRNFLKIAGIGGAALAAAGGATYAATKFSSNAKGKIVIVGGGAAGLSIAARLNRWLENPDITVVDPSDRHYYQPGFTLIGGGVSGAFCVRIVFPVYWELPYAPPYQL